MPCLVDGESLDECFFFLVEELLRLLVDLDDDDDDECFLDFLDLEVLVLLDDSLGSSDFDDEALWSSDGEES